MKNDSNHDFNYGVTPWWIKFSIYKLGTLLQPPKSKQAEKKLELSNVPFGVKDERWVIECRRENLRENKDGP